MFITVGTNTINVNNITYITRTGAMIVIHFVGVENLIKLEGEPAEDFLLQLSRIA
jgi:hypothetical protein